MTIDTTRLRALAEKATPGPWAWFGNLKSNSIYLATVRGETVWPDESEEGGEHG